MPRKQNVAKAQRKVMRPGRWFSISVPPATHAIILRRANELQLGKGVYVARLVDEHEDELRAAERAERPRAALDGEPS